ncbi:MAG TPA: hypothetical protein PKD12_01980 [Nitrospira sp.]|nr:hypothetical protein [Nitrospira sp.]
MTPAEDMAKKVVGKSDWLKASGVEAIYSVSGCISQAFAEYITFWQHKGYWLFDSPNIIAQLAQEHSIDLAGTTMFYDEVYEQEYDDVKNGGFCTDQSLHSRRLSSFQSKRSLLDLMSSTMCAATVQSVPSFPVMRSPMTSRPTHTAYYPT